MKKTIIKFLFLLFSVGTLFVDIGRAFAETPLEYYFDGEGLAYGSYGGGSGTAIMRSPYNRGCNGIKINLVKVTDSGPSWASFYHLFINGTYRYDLEVGANPDYNTYHKLQVKQFFDRGLNPAFSSSGVPGVYGQIGGWNAIDGYSISAFATKNLYTPDIASEDPRFFVSSYGGLNFSAAKLKAALDKNKTAPAGKVQLFYRLLYELLKSGNGMQINNNNFPHKIDMSSINSPAELKEYLNKKEENYEAIQELSQYRMIIEPIYTIGQDSPHSTRLFMTSKATAYYLTHKGDLSRFSNVDKFINNAYVTGQHGTINDATVPANSVATLLEMPKVNNKYGYVILGVVDEPTIPKLTCPSGTGKNGGTEPYNNYYMMISPTKPSDLGKDITFNYRDSNTFNTVIEDLNNHAPAGFSYSLNNISFVSNKNPIEDISSESNLKNFVDNYWKAFTGANSTYKDSRGDYYIALTDESRNFSLDKNAVKSKSVFPETSLVNGSLSGSTYSFTIKKKIPNTMNTSGTYYSTKYRVAYCISKEEKKDCDPTTNKAVCTSDDSGTKAVFHENEKLKTCTLNDTTESGFKIYNLKDTKNTYNDKSYCEVACKDDFDLELPTSKLAAAGQYFVLNNYTPKISIKRTCVTTNVKFSEFEADLKNARDDMIEAYNTWQDYKEYADGQASNPLDNGGDSGSEDGCCGSCGCDSKGENCSCCSEPTCNWSYDGWKTNYTATNGTHFAESGCDGTTDCSPCSGTKSYCDYTSSELKTNARNAANSKYSEYVAAKNKYNNLIGKFEMCSKWVDDKKLDYTSDSRANLEVTFQYNDKDGSVFGSSGTYGRKYAYNYTKTTDNSEDQLKTEVTYWQQGENTNETYSTGGDDSKDTKLIDIISCDNVGKTCRASDSRAIKIKNNPFVTSSYIKRTENITYTYHLAPLSTLVPSGRIIQTSSKGAQSAIDLEAEAVPININTPAGTNPYVITVTELRDKVRLASENKKSVKDSFVKQFLENALTGQEKTSRSSSNDVATYTCNYEVKNDIVKDGDLNFFYRTIDMNNPFPNTREIGYNWTTSKANKVINNMKNESNNYQTLVSGDKFSFTMTPVIMQQIRRYNGRRNNTTSNSYSDWNLQCSDYDASGKGYHCYSTFLTCLASGGTTSTPGARISGGCNSIFGSSLNRYRSISNYDLTDLRNNRALLIKKQDALDGRGG